MSDGTESSTDEGGIDDLPHDPPVPILFGQPARFSFRPGAPVSAPDPLFAPTKSTPLEEDSADSEIPQPALWVMKYRRHLTLHSRVNEEMRRCLGEGDSRVFVIDDGDTDVMITRAVGVDEQKVSYFLVGRLPLYVCEEHAAGQRHLDEIFSEASELAMCSVYAQLEAVSNVTVVEQYKKYSKVPPDYLPPHPLISFSNEE